LNSIFVDNKEIIALILGFGIVAIAATKIAKVFQKIHLPIITGFLISGIFCGPYVLGLIPHESVTRLNFINEIALAFIAFAAGAELYLRELRSRISSIKWNTIGQIVVTFGFSSIAVFYLSDLIPYMRDMNFNGKLVSSILAGTIFVARSPASAIAVINELRAKGPFTQTVMGVTVLIDFIVIILFSVCMSVSISLMGGREFDALSIVIPLSEILLSVGIGYLLGKVLDLVLSLRIRIESKALVVIALGYSIYFLNHSLHDYSGEYLTFEFALEPLIVCIIASLYVTNYTKNKPEFLKILEIAGPMVYAAFFTLTGSSLSIYILMEIWGVALLLFALRLVTIVGGSYFGGVMAEEPWTSIHVGWMPYVTQAGIALGLSTLVSNTFPGWGQEFATMIIAIIVINQIVGPPLFKWALTRVGENRSQASFEFDGVRDAIIFGYENQSVSLANQLMDKDWEVKIATLREQGTFEEPKGLNIQYFTEINLEQMQELDTAKSEAIICMLSDKENLEICELAYQHFGTPDMIVRLHDRYYHDKFAALDARVVDPSTAIVSLMEHFVRSPQATSLLLGMEPGQDTRDLEVLNPNFHGLALRDLRLPADIIILSIKRSGQMIISHGYTRLRVGDIVTFVGSNDSLDELMRKLEG